MADATAKRTSAKKTPTKKTPTKKRAARKSSATKTPAKKGVTKSAKAPGTQESSSQRSGRAPRAEPPPRRSGAQMAGAARDAVEGLTGRSPEAVTALERSEDGWRVAVEVLELERIPSTTDVMATYEVTLDEQGELQGYRRAHRYLRGSPGDE
jgi:hypothetical protein